MVEESEKLIKNISYGIIAVGVLATFITAILTFWQSKIRDKVVKQKEHQRVAEEKYKEFERGNQLFPYLKVSFSIEMDYSNIAPEYKEHIDSFKKYVYAQPTFGTSGSKTLPANGFIHTGMGTIVYDKFKIEKFNPEEIDIQFWQLNFNLVRSIFPEMFLIITQDIDSTNGFEERKANLLIKLTEYSLNKEFPGWYKYTFDPRKNIIIFEGEITNPTPIQHDGLIQSVFSCKNGYIGLGMEKQELSNVVSKPRLLELKYGFQFSQQTIISFHETSKVPYQIVDDTFHNRRYFLKKGSDLVKALTLK